MPFKSQLIRIPTTMGGRASIRILGEAVTLGVTVYTGRGKGTQSISTSVKMADVMAAIACNTKLREAMLVAIGTRLAIEAEGLAKLKALAS